MAEKLESLQGLNAEQLQQPTTLAKWDEREPQAKKLHLNFNKLGLYQRSREK